MALMKVSVVVFPPQVFYENGPRHVRLCGADPQPLESAREHVEEGAGRLVPPECQTLARPQDQVLRLHPILPAEHLPGLLLGYRLRQHPGCGPEDRGDVAQHPFLPPGGRVPRPAPASRPLQAGPVPGLRAGARRLQKLSQPCQECHDHSRGQATGDTPDVGQEVWPLKCVCLCVCM